MIAFQFVEIDTNLREFVSASNYTLGDVCLRSPDLKSGETGECLMLGILDKIPNPSNKTDQEIQMFMTEFYKARFVTCTASVLYLSNLSSQAGRGSELSLRTGLRLLGSAGEGEGRDAHLAAVGHQQGRGGEEGHGVGAGLH